MEVLRYLGKRVGPLKRLERLQGILIEDDLSRLSIWRLGWPGCDDDLLASVLQVLDKLH